MSKVSIGGMKKKWCAALIALVAGSGLQAGIVASWDFEEATDGQYGVQSIVATTSSVNGVVAYGFANNPVYNRGADGVGHGTASGYLRVGPGYDNLFTGFQKFSFSFDARLTAVPGATQVLMRYGSTDTSTTAWNVYTGTDAKIHLKWYDTTGATFDLNTSAASVFGDSTFHHYEITYDGSVAQIKVDGVAQLLEDGSTDSWALSLGDIRSTGNIARLGIGGMIRDNDTFSQEFSGTLDNVVINNIPEPATLSLLTIGVAGIMFLRRR